MRKQEFQTFLQVSSEPISNFFSIFIQLPIIDIQISRRRLLPGELLLPKIILALCKTRKDFQKLTLTITVVHSHFCLCEVLARQKQVLKKFRPKIPIDFLLDPAKAVRWNGSGGGAGCSNENIISTMQCSVCWPQLCSAFMKIYPILHAPSTYILQCALMLFRAGGLLNLGLPPSSSSVA